MFYHFSDEPNIQCFEPRTPLAYPKAEPMVWAINDVYQYVYWTPRECPRVCFWPVADTSSEHMARLWSSVTGRMVIAIEAASIARLQSTHLYRYTMPPETFVSHEEDWGVYVSHSTVEPIAVEPMGNLLDALTAAPVELRMCPTLEPLKQAVISTSFSWHIW